ncbi:SLBB domain-containing protein [Pusillimonas sp. CC-YST705]|uniref:SLBB domain-containing protein n=1 Tax=Mesopusillimonas faecipullorum TaxID=2755040 RepID=A0ABS8CFI2_9BURK|nr:SLBB domain-containing protein [Mesopusillimonas faecipullorum]MCB5364564.1 SLBB domain-containing protein [Mesopusillimonas faecipullorum]
MAQQVTEVDGTPSRGATMAVTGAAVSAVGPGDVLNIVVFGHPDLTSTVTITVDGEITLPLLGVMRVTGESPSAIARRIEKGMSDGGYLRNPRVSVEVAQVRSQVASILGEVHRPGRYAIEGKLSLLELLALAGGVRPGASEQAVLVRRGAHPGDAEQRIEMTIGTRDAQTQALQDTDLQSGDVLYVPLAKRFFVYGEVHNPGAYPMENGMNVMRAVALAGGLNPRASERRISIKRTDEKTGATESIKVGLDDVVQAGDVVYVDERWF